MKICIAGYGGMENSIRKLAIYIPTMAVMTNFLLHFFL